MSGKGRSMPKKKTKSFRVIKVVYAGTRRRMGQTGTLVCAETSMHCSDDALWIRFSDGEVMAFARCELLEV